MTTLQIVRRRWHVMLAGLLMTGGLVVAVASVVPATYAATAQVVLLPPHSSHSGGTVPGTTATTLEEENPYLGMAGLNGMADLVARAMTDEMTAKGLVKAGVTGTYRVERDTMAAAPILAITVEDGVASRASTELQVVMKQVPLAAARLQSNSAVPASARISVGEVVRPGSPLRSGKVQLRAVGVALVGGLVLTVFAASFFDAWSVRRRRSRDVASAAGSGSVGTEDGATSANIVADGSDGSVEGQGGKIAETEVLDVLLPGPSWGRRAVAAGLPLGDDVAP